MDQITSKYPWLVWILVTLFKQISFILPIFSQLDHASFWPQATSFPPLHWSYQPGRENANKCLFQDMQLCHCICLLMQRHRGSANWLLLYTWAHRCSQLACVALINMAVKNNIPTLPSPHAMGTVGLLSHHTCLGPKITHKHTHCKRWAKKNLVQLNHTASKRLKGCPPILQTPFTLPTSSTK